jgi:large subunit ribosomal protein L14
MLRYNSMCWCKDNTGVKLVKIFQVAGSRHRRKANFGDMVLIIIKARNLRAKNLKNARQMLRLRRGSIHRGLIVNVSSWLYRSIGVYVRWTENALILVNKKKIPLGTKLYIALPKEFLDKYPALGSICHSVV